MWRALTCFNAYHMLNPSVRPISTDSVSISSSVFRSWKRIFNLTLQCKNSSWVSERVNECMYLYGVACWFCCNSRFVFVQLRMQLLLPFFGLVFIIRFQFIVHSLFHLIFNSIFSFAVDDGNDDDDDDSAVYVVTLVAMRLELYFSKMKKKWKKYIVQRTHACLLACMPDVYALHVQSNLNECLDVQMQNETWTNVVHTALVSAALSLTLSLA